MKRKQKVLKRKKLIVFGVEGKNNKTETLYFRHFIPYNEDFIIKIVSCGCTDPKNMIDSIKQKRKVFDYQPREDLTFLFMDADYNESKIDLINSLKSKQPKDINIIVSSPTFELWFYNHFVRSTKTFRTNDDLIRELRKFITDYSKNRDSYKDIYFLTSEAIINSKHQISANNKFCFTDVYLLFDKKILKKE